jgi:predicted site-specific integrase-resolvase
MQATQEKVWKRNDVAEFFGISTATVRRWERDGKLPGPACVIAKRPYWRPEDIRASFNKKSEG